METPDSIGLSEFDSVSAYLTWLVSLIELSSRVIKMRNFNKYYLLSGNLEIQIQRSTQKYPVTIPNLSNLNYIFYKKE